ncbi:MAG: hypothetical protein WD960_15030 [Gemmatimonadota bacterium]
MVVRQVLACDACAAKTITRVQVGHGDSQVHAFPCVSCGTGITFSLRIDRKNVKVEFGPDPTNASWVNDEVDAVQSLAFAVELLIPQEALHAGMGMTPFLLTSQLFRDWPTFAKHEAHRRAWQMQAPTALARLRTHLERGNHELFIRDLEEFDRSLPDTAPDWRKLKEYADLLRVAANLMALPRPDWLDRIQERTETAWETSRERVGQLVTESIDAGQSLQLWHELGSFADRFHERWSLVGLLLQPAYWRDPSVAMEDFVVCDKRFSALKLLYIEAFETMCRISMLAVAVEAIISRRNLRIPTKKDSMGVWDYDRLPNSQKSHHLKGLPVDDLFVPFMDTTLRNGIGHNSARYDAATDQVVWTAFKKSGPVENRMHYTNFCRSVLEVCSTLLHVQQYFFALHIRAKATPW